MIENAKAAAPVVPAPRLLQADLDRLSQSFGEPINVAILSLDRKWVAHVRGDLPAPQQSVSKLWVAVAALDAVDRGELNLDGLVLFTDADRSVFYQPIVSELRSGVLTTTLRELLRRAIVESDNAANDRVLRLLGGAEAVEQAVRQKGLAVSVGAEERELQSKIAGLDWRPEFGYGTAFKVARAQLPLPQRRQARDQYLAEPADGASAIAIAQALARLYRGDLLSAASTNQLLAWMEQVTTGPKRLRGGLPMDWRIAHKTGTGQDLDGGSIGINDVGLLIAPDGEAYAVAVMIPHTRQPVPARLQLMQAIAQAVVADWQRDQPNTAAVSRQQPPLAGPASAAADGHPAGGL